MQCGDPFRLATAIGVGENDARSTVATLLTLGRVGDDDVLAGDVLAAGLAMMFRLRSGLRGSQSRMARPTPSQPMREQAKNMCGTTAVAGNIQHWAEYSLPARPIYHPATCAENDWSHGRFSRRTEGVLLGISRSTAHIAIACSFHSAEDQAFPLAAGTAPQIGKPDSH